MEGCTSIDKISIVSNTTFYTTKPEFSNFSIFLNNESSQGIQNTSHQRSRSMPASDAMTASVEILLENKEKENHLQKSDSHNFNRSILAETFRRVGGFTNFSKKNGVESPIHIRELLVNWSENTTMHGVKYLWEQSDLKARRYLWLLFVLCGIGLLAWLIGDRIFYFYQRPVTVNVEITYNSSIIFPAITICNQNSFRLTKANKYDFYSTLDHIYQHGNFSAEDQKYSRTQNTSMEEIYNKTSFQIDEMLLKCTWNGVDCDANYFTRVFTEQGVCFGFNYNQSIYVTKTGSANGLSLLLDVHHYDYMPGPIASAGVRFLLHEATTYPRVMDLGEAVPTGTHTYIGTKVKRSSYLSPPYGDCSKETQLEYYSSYNQHNCRIECEAKYIMKECKCRPFFMPKLSNVSTCTLYEHNNCFLVKKSDFKTLEHKLCKYCDPLPCVSTVYESSLSYASISKYVLAKLTSNEFMKKVISDRLVQTNDIVSHAVNKYKNLSLEIANNILDFNIDLRNILLVKVPEILQYDDDFINKAQSFHKQALNQKIEATKFQIKIVNKYFVRTVESVDESTLSSVSFQNFEFLIYFKSHVKHLQEIPLTQNVERRNFFYGARLKLETRRLCASAAYEKVKEILHCYRNAQPYSLEKSSGNFTVEEGLSAIPAALLRKSLNSTFTQKKFGNRMLNDLIMLNATYTKMDEVLQFAMRNGNEILPPHLNLTRICDDFSKYSKDWSDDRVNYLPDAFYFPLREMRQRLARLEESQKKLHSFFEDLKLREVHLSNGILELQRNWEIFDELMNVTALFRDHLHADDEKKPTVHKYYLSELVQNRTLPLGKFKLSVNKMSGLLKMHLRENQPVIMQLMEELQIVWRRIITDEDSWSYYRFKNWNWINLTIGNFSQEIEANLTEYQKKINFTSIIGNKDRFFLNRLQRFKNDLVAYHDKIQINEEFFKDNILKLDFFFREMSFEKIVQQEAYKISALLGDIGGMLGLFVGASFLTILEIFDFLGQIIFQAHQKRKLKMIKNVFQIKK